MVGVTGARYEQRGVGGNGASLYLAFTGSNTTMSSVQIGPRNSDPNHHASPLLPLVWARPALMSDSVNQPTAY